MNYLEEFLKCKIVDNKSEDLSEKNSNELFAVVIKKNEECVLIGEKSLIQIKGNKLENEISKALDLSIRRIKAENGIYRKLLDNPKMSREEMDDLIVINNKLDSLIRSAEDSSWNNVSIALSNQNAPVKKDSGIGFTDILLLMGLVFTYMFVSYEKMKHNGQIKDKNNDKNNGT